MWWLCYVCDVCRFNSSGAFSGVLAGGSRRFIAATAVRSMLLFAGGESDGLVYSNALDWYDTATQVCVLLLMFLFVSFFVFGACWRLVLLVVCVSLPRLRFVARLRVPIVHSFVLILARRPGVGRI